MASRDMYQHRVAKLLSMVESNTISISDNRLRIEIDKICDLRPGSPLGRPSSPSLITIQSTDTLNGSFTARVVSLRERIEQIERSILHDENNDQFENDSVNSYASNSIASSSIRAKSAPSGTAKFNHLRVKKSVLETSQSIKYQYPEFDDDASQQTYITDLTTFTTDKDIKTKKRIHKRIQLQSRTKNGNRIKLHAISPQRLPCHKMACQLSEDDIIEKANERILKQKEVSLRRKEFCQSILQHIDDIIHAKDARKEQMLRIQEEVNKKKQWLSIIPIILYMSGIKEKAFNEVEMNSNNLLKQVQSRRDQSPVKVRDKEKSKILSNDSQLKQNVMATRIQRLFMNNKQKQLALCYIKFMKLAVDKIWIVSIKINILRKRRAVRVLKVAIPAMYESQMVICLIVNIR